MTEIPTGYPGAPPGWYPDPAGGPGQRWWDGYAWTDTVVLPEPPPPPNLPPPPPSHLAPPPNLPPPPPAAVAHPGWTAVPPRPHPNAASPSLVEGLVRHELLMTRFARRAAAMPAIYFIVSLIFQQVDASQLRTYGHQFHLIYEAAQNNQPTPTFSNTPALNPVTPLLGLLTLAAIIVACIWQFRAASAARALGRPATHSPGWGVGSWFVPIVNLFMPYQAVRDCLAPDDPQRSLVLQWWLIFLGTWILGVTAGIAALFSQGVGLAFSFPAALLAVVLFALGPRVVSVISASHQQAATP
ncbi:MAG TPA: DUF4328 domain-containing protein [Acidimicrobiales bacterium]|nr:DUF4328 domain-containing protein [Acidimicrobiales bacterium]